MSLAEDMQSIYGEGLGDNRRVPRSAKKTHDIQALSQLHHEVISMRLAGLKNKEISNRTGMSEAAVSVTLNSTLAVRKLQQLRLIRDGMTIDKQKKISELAVKALEVYDRIFDSDDSEASLALKKSTADVITKDLSGLRAPLRSENLSLSGQLSEETVERITMRGIQAAKEMGVVVDIEVEVVKEEQK